MPAENTSPFKGQWGKQCGEDRHWLKLSRHSSACLGLAVRIRMRCLVIEDESITGHYICNGLKEAGHTPLWFATALADFSSLRVRAGTSLFSIACCRAAWMACRC